MAIGATLRRAREEKGLSLDVLSRRTRVRPPLLDAIERDAHSALPPRPYIRGMVSAYAREVGLDPDLTVREYLEDLDLREAQTAATAPVVAQPAHEPSGLRFGSAALLVVALLGIGIAVAWNVFTGLPAGEPGAVGTSGSAQPLATDATPQPPAGNQLVAAPGELVLAIEASSPAWVAAASDGTRVVYRILQAGERETLRATREIALRIGDAGAVTWTVNGRPLGPMGKPGEVRTVTLSHDNASTIR